MYTYTGLLHEHDTLKCW